MKNLLVPVAGIAALAVGAAAWFVLFTGGDAPVEASGVAADALPDETPSELTVVAPAARRVAADAPVASEPKRSDVEGSDVEQEAVAAQEAVGTGFVDVTVLGPAGEPHAGVRVSLQSSSDDPRDWIRDSSGPPTDAEGRTRVKSVPVGTYRAVARSDGLRASRRVQLTPANPSADLVIELKPAGSVVGELLDIHGDPAAGVGLSIHLHGWPGERGGGVTGYMESGVVGDDGTFRFDSLLAGHYTLYTRAKGEDLRRVPDRHVELDVIEGETTRVVFEDLRGSYVQLGGVVLRDGVPLAGAAIRIQWADRRRGYLGRAAETDEDGRFEVTLDESGEYRFQISDRRGPGGSVFRLVTVPPGPSHEVAISFSTGTLSGHVYDAAGKACAGVGLRAFGDALEGDEGSTVASATTDADGAYEFRSLLAGTYKVVAGSSRTSASRPRGAASNLHLGGATLAGLRLEAGEHLSDADLHLPPAASVTGRVTDSDGHGVVSSRVECWRIEATADGPPLSHHTVPSARSDAEGEFRIGGLQSGSYRLRAISAREISPWIEVEAQAEMSVAATLVVAPGTLLTFEVNAEGRPVERCYVQVVDENEITVASAILEDGTTTLGPLLPGTYSVSARYDAGGPSATESVTFAGQSEATVRLALP